MKIVPFMKKRALSVMMAGFVIALTGVITLMRTRHLGNNMPAVAMGITVFGLLIYILGRIFVAINKSQAKAENEIRRRSQ